MPHLRLLTGECLLDDGIDAVLAYGTRLLALDRRARRCRLTGHTLWGLCTLQVGPYVGTSITAGRRGGGARGIRLSLRRLRYWPVRRSASAIKFLYRMARRVYGLGPVPLSLPLTSAAPDIEVYLRL